VPTIHQVAQAAGVAIGTASKALSGAGKLRPETRSRVRAAATRLGYRPNDLAHSLTRGRSFTIGLVTSDLHGRFSLPILAGVENAMGDARTSVFLCNVRDDPAREQQVVDQLLAKRVDGLIITGSRLNARPPVDVGCAGVPVLYAFARTTDPGALCLLPDNEQGGRIAVEHLLNAGRRRIAYLTGPVDWPSVRQRRAGMEAALRERGLDPAESPESNGPWREDWGYAGALQLLERRPPPDAIFCGSDLLARGAADALRERGVRIPDDVALIGFDNWEIIAATTRPPLTTVDMELEQLGQEAGRRLLALIDGHAESGTVLHPCSLACRASCGGRDCSPAPDPSERLTRW
jgi:LacI family transcriptional regulator